MENLFSPISKIIKNKISNCVKKNYNIHFFFMKKAIL